MVFGEFLLREWKETSFFILVYQKYVKRVRNTCDRICKQIKKYLYKEQTIDNGPLGLNRIVSDVCEQIYNLTPVINNEQINRHVLSSQSLKSRNLLFTAMINGEDLEKYMQGTSAEATIYRAVFVHTAGDDNMRLVRGLIDRFIEDSVGKKNCFKEILGTLTSCPYGMRFGVIPLFLLQSLLEKESMPVIYRNNREVLLNSETLNNIILYPDEYYLYVEEKTAEKDRYLKRVESIFSDYEKFCHDVDARNLIGRITCTIQAWYRSLPQISTTFGVADNPEDDIETVKKFRRLISGINVNPRELLFDRFATLFGTDDLDIVAERVSALRNTIDQHLDIVREKEQDLIRECFGIKGNLKLNLQGWYKELPEQTKKTVFSNRTGKLVSYISLIGEATELEIPNEIARIVSGNFIEDWDDQASEYFRETLLEMLQEIADKESEAGEHVQTIELHTSEGETKDILYDFDMTKISPAGTFFKNALDDVIEEYADNIEDSEMIGILIDLIKSKAGER